MKKHKSRNRLSALVLIIVMVLGMMPAVATAAPANGSGVLGGRANGSPVDPGDVMLFKEATPVDGMVNTWDVTLRIEGKDNPVSSDVILVIDTSGSMAGNRISKAKEAANAFVDALLGSSASATQIGLVSFAGNVGTTQALTSNAGLLKGKIENLSATGGTFTQAGVRTAAALLTDSTAQNKHIVLLSDGEPTYNYRIDNPNNYLIDGGPPGPYQNKKQTSTDVPEDRFLYQNNRTGAGNSMWYLYETTSGERRYYNSGNCAIAEAGFAGEEGINLFTVGLQTNATGSGVLNDMKQGCGTFTEVTDVDDLESVFETIAGQIVAAVRDATVVDPMGPGFEIPAANVSSIVTVPDTPEATYDPVAKRIEWNPGTLITPLPSDSTIKYAQLQYRIEINDDILSQTPDENDEYPTNGNAEITYMDVYGNSQTASFPVPTVNPVLYKVVKELQDKDGNVITADRNFTVKVTGPGEDGDETVRSFTLNTSTESSTKLMTDLRYASTYTFVETGNLSDYEVKYFVNGEEVSNLQFYIADGNTEDVEVKVINREKPGTLKIVKVLDQGVISDQTPPTGRSGSRGTPVSFSFTVTGPGGYSEAFNLPDNGLWTKTLGGLAKGTYTVTEADADGFATTVKVGDGNPIVGNSATVAIDIGALNKTVTVTNKQTKNMSVTATKSWSENAPNDKPEIYFQLWRVNLDDTTTKIGSPRLVPTGNEVTWNQTDTDVNPVDFVRYAPNGDEYEYKVQEVNAAGNDYTPAGYTKQEDALTVTNTYRPVDLTNITSVRFEKNWAGVPAGVTPPTIYVRVKADGEVYKTAELKHPNTAVEWKNLPLKDVDGNFIEYTVEELPIIDFDEGDPALTEGVIADVICTSEQSSSEWSIENPTFVITRLTAGEDEGTFVIWTLNHMPDQNHNTFLSNVIDAGPNDSPLLSELKSYLEGGGDYFIWLEGPEVDEDLIPGDPDPDKGKVTIDVEFNEEGGILSSDLDFKGENTWTNFAVGRYSCRLFKITNTYNQETVNIPGSKTWDDNDDQDGLRPESITIKLYKKVGSADLVLVDSQTVEPDAQGKWTWNFTNKPKYENGVEIVYSITEDEIEGYTPTVTDYNVTNKHTPYTTNISITKDWDDADDQDRLRPEKVTVQLYADNVKVTGKELELNAGNNWKGTFEDLPVNNSGKAIVYTVKEAPVPEYTEEISTSGSAAEGYTFKITNKHAPYTRDVGVTKVWDDADNQDGLRPDPEKVTVQLYADNVKVTDKTLELNAGNNWTGTFEDLPVNNAGI
ncbi:MAG: Cna B-type domain-containing protein, partial [Clostridiaceae bacterium]|nr:Cna B-type domain-containing protein [Clostridiaceae bacterium]